jgi:hypothetical protein
MVDRSQLRQFMIESFSDDELADLIFDYFPNVRASLGEGMTLGQKVRTLIDFADRHDRFDHLVIVIEKLRPEAYCNFFQTELDLPPEPETAARDPNKLFISYANPDADFAARLAGDLRQRGFDIWMAPDSILPGEKWVAAIERGLRESGIFLLVLTPAGIDSKWVSQETQVAIMLENEGQMRIYPLRVQRAEVPLLLSTRQHIAFDTDYERGLAGLLAALRPGSQSPAPEAPAAPRPSGVATPGTAEVSLPVLIIDWPDAPNQELTLNKPTITVGRTPENDVVLDLPIVSSRHLRLDVDDSGAGPRVWLTDLGSRNGTFLSGRRLPPQTRQLLEPGDVVNLGDHAGRAISLILHPGYSTNAPLPLPAARPATTATAVDVPPSDGPAAALSRKLPAPLARVPLWAYAAAGLLLVVLLAFLALRGGRGERPPTADEASPAATRVVAAVEATATEAATEAASLVAAPTDELPTATTAPTVVAEPTAEATATSAPTMEATAEATATTAPTAEASATAEPTVAPTEPATVTPVALPTEAPNFTISRSTPLSFEALGDWLRDDRNSRSAGEIAVSADQAHSGSYSLRLAYDFPGSGDDYVMFRAPRAFRIANDRERRFLKLWVLGDGATLNLSAIVEDNEGELWKVYLGEVGDSEWQQLDGYIGDTSWPSGIYGNRGNGVVDFPVRLRGLHVDDVTSSFVGAGAIYIDDVTVE